MSDKRARQSVRESRDPDAVIAILVRGELSVGDAGEALLLDNPSLLESITARLTEKQHEVEQRARRAIEQEWEQAVVDGRACPECHGTLRVVTWDTLDSLSGDYAEFGPCPKIEQAPEAHSERSDRPVEALWWGHAGRGHNRPDPTAYMNSLGRCFRLPNQDGHPSPWLTVEESEEWQRHNELFWSLQPVVQQLQNLLLIGVGKTVEVSNPRARVKDNTGARVEHQTRGQVDRVEKDARRARLVLADGRTAWTSWDNLRVVDAPRAVIADERRAAKKTAEEDQRLNEIRARSPKGKRVTLADGKRGKVFWSGIGKTGRPTMGVRVPGEDEARWVEIEMEESA
jgi:hypothetical protein